MSWPLAALLAAALTLGAFAPDARSDPAKFGVAELFFDINDTDGDAGALIANL